MNRLYSVIFVTWLRNKWFYSKYSFNKNDEENTRKILRKYILDNSYVIWPELKLERIDLEVFYNIIDDELVDEIPEEPLASKATPSIGRIHKKEKAKPKETVTLTKASSQYHTDKNTQKLSDVMAQIEYIFTEYSVLSHYLFLLRESFEEFLVFLCFLVVCGTMIRFNSMKDRLRTYFRFRWRKSLLRKIYNYIFVENKFCKKKVEINQASKNDYVFKNLSFASTSKVLNYLTMEDCLEVSLVNKDTSESLTNTKSIWRPLYERYVE